MFNEELDVTGELKDLWDSIINLNLFLNMCHSGHKVPLYIILYNLHNL